MKTSIVDHGVVHGSGFTNIDGQYSMSSGTYCNAVKAANLLADNLVETVICSGRGPVFGEEYVTTEATLMADYLVREGFDHKRILVEGDSTSLLGNWACSAVILQKRNAEDVIGITAPVNVKRGILIGSFVAENGGFALRGYYPSDRKTSVKSYLREIINCELTRAFLDKNISTPNEDLIKAYEEYKSQIGLASLKRYLHRNATVQKAA